MFSRGASRDVGGGVANKEKGEVIVVGRLIINLGRERGGEGSGVPPFPTSPTYLSSLLFPLRDLEHGADDTVRQLPRRTGLHISIARNQTISPGHVSIMTGPSLADVCAGFAVVCCAAR